jgi:phospholipase/carboxylesterase
MSSLAGAFWNVHMTNPHLTEAVVRYGAAAKDASLAVILVHGRGQSPAWMEEAVVQRFGHQDIAWYAPAAADSSWYPARYLEPLEANEPSLTHALQRLESLSAQLVQDGFPYERQVLMGFSQGACLCSEFAWRSAHRYRALVVWTGALIGSPGAMRLPAATGVKDLPVLLSTWTEDPYVPVDSVRESARWFDAAGARVILRAEAGTEHGIRNAEIQYAQQLLA